MARVVTIAARDGDPLPSGGDFHTAEGALVIVRWAVPDLTEDEAVRVRDEAFRWHLETSASAFKALVQEVLGPDVEVR